MSEADGTIYSEVKKKIEIESIYDNSKKAKIGVLPSKLQKTNLPVTFHKKIKSSGYSAAPGSLKYMSSQQ